MRQRVHVSSRARRRVLALSAVVAVGLVVAGCTGDEPDPRPSGEETVEPSPTETPEPEPTETVPAKPERPAAMDRDDAEGAAAAAEYFLELYPYVMTTGDTAEWEAMSHAECDACTGFISDARKRAESGDTYSGGEVDAQVQDPHKYLRDDATGIYPLDVDVTQAAILIEDAAGEPQLTTSNESFQRRAEVGTKDGSWIIVELTEVPAS